MCIMKKVILILAVFFPTILFAQTTSIYDIQYTEDAGSDGWSHPSLYNGQTVTTGGIVTANNYSGGRYFIECSNGGPWNGLYIYDNNNSPNIGDSILITGLVAEWQGYTEIKNVSSYSVKSTGNNLPTPTVVPSGEIGWEQYEGLLVQVNNCNIIEIFGTSGAFSANDGSGDGEVSTGIYSLADNNFSLIDNYPFQKIVGVVGIDNWNRKLNPRNIDDFVSVSNEFALATDDKYIQSTETFAYPVKLELLNQSNTITSYSLKMQYDNTLFSFEGFSKAGTISESGTITDASVTATGNIELNFSGNISCDNIETLVYLNFSAISNGDALLKFNNPTINGSSVNYLAEGALEYGDGSCDIPKEDTLTVVQRPLLNIPSIVTSGQEMDIACFAPETTTDWNVELFYNNVTVPLSVNQSVYDTNLKKWTLTVSIPSVDLYELYDMRVTASGDISDEVANAVKVIDQFKEKYYFIHITDLHLPGHTFYGNNGYETDHSEMDDLQAVIDDINLLNPEFVLITGDIINEGELEDFECLRNHSLTYNILKKFEMPIYVVPGNHDLGGWDDTPPEQGTARKEWWKFFGWRQHEIPPTQAEYLTQDYSFDYGNTHYVGLEAYDNYDKYMYSVYGDESFISSQMTWLNNDLAAAGDKTKVLFYHYDFKHELNLSTLGVDMALWGHTHSDKEDTTHPYDISTAAVCDNARTFRVIRVDNGVLTAESSVQTHSDGDMLTISYANSNDGSSNNNSATINNNYNQAFDNGLVKFIMPKSDYGYSITNGTLMQTLVDGTEEVCYVLVTIPSNNNIVVSIENNTTPPPVTSIYDIQYTTIEGDGTYPSLYDDQDVITGGIVTAVNYMGNRFFISSSSGGAWNGLLVFDNNYNPSVGDSVLIAGKVDEYNGFTEITNLTSFEIISSSNEIPKAAQITTAEVTSEQYEGVLVKLVNCNAEGTFNEYGNWAVNDGSGKADICTGIFDLQGEGFKLYSNYPFDFVKGPVAYYYGSISVQPRSLEDISAGEGGFIISTTEKTVDNNLEFSLPVKISIIKTNEDISAYTLAVQYNSEVFEYIGYETSGTLSDGTRLTDESIAGNVSIEFTGNSSFNKDAELIKLKFKALKSGTANLSIKGTIVNSKDVDFFELGRLESTYKSSVSIYDLQYTSIEGDGTYPSLYSGQMVTTGGIVTAVNYIGDRFFISSSHGGAWNGLLVFDENYSPSIGDSVLIKGTIEEYNGYTEIKDLTSFEVKSSSNELPQATPINTNNISLEQYEGVLVKVSDVLVKGDFDSKGKWAVDDGSGIGIIGSGIYSLQNDWASIYIDYPFNYVQGVVAYFYGNTSILPRSLEDISASSNGFILSTIEKDVDNNSSFNLPVKISIVKRNENISSYTLKMQYNSEVFEYLGYDLVGTLSDGASITDESTTGSVSLGFIGSVNFDKVDNLVTLKFKALNTGAGNLSLTGSTINEEDVTFSELGNLSSSYVNSVNLLKVNEFRNYPNPFKDKISFEYSLQEDSKVYLAIYSLSGQQIKVLKDSREVAGENKIVWDATNSSDQKVDFGTYIFNLTINDKLVKAGKIVYVK